MSSFFWKFTRDGFVSRTYIALIFDVHSDHIEKDNAKTIWHTTFGCLSSLLTLIQDVELVNQNNLLQTAYRKIINDCGFDIKNSEALRAKINLVCGREMMGRHKGNPLDWGYYCIRGKNHVRCDEILSGTNNKCTNRNSTK